MHAATLAVGALLLSTSSVASIPVQEAVAPHEVDAQRFHEAALARRQELNVTSIASSVVLSATSMMSSTMDTASSGMASATSSPVSESASTVSASASSAAPSATSTSSTSTNGTTTSSPSTNGTTSESTECLVDQTQAPGNLTMCGNATLFSVWRPKARVTPPEGWLNDATSMVQLGGVLHAGWQCHPQHIQWGNISICAATSTDLGVTWTDLNKTLAPSEIYDIRGVFDGTVLVDGYEGYPTILYTATSPIGPLGATVQEIEGVETQAIAYTTDGAKSWIKLPYGQNPVIYEWPMDNLTGFRDPYIFPSPRLSALIASNNSANSTSNTTAGSDVFATISGGVHDVGAKLFLYRQNQTGDVLNWNYVGPLLETSVNQTWSDWSGNYGINFETAAANRLNASGDALDAGDDATAVDFLTFGTEGARDDVHQKHWGLWAAVNYTLAENGTLNTTILYSGVVDWGSSYAFVNFPYVSNGTAPRQISVGWTYEADSTLALAKPMGYQGAFTTMRDIYVKSTSNVDPTDPDLNLKASWGVKNESDGSVTVSTLGQRIVSEVTDAWKAAANVSTPNATSLSTSGYQPFMTQPQDRYYVLAGQFDFEANSTGSVGFRVLASDQEYTDILYDPVAQNLTVTRNMSSLIKTFDNTTEVAKLKLWKLADSNTTTLNLTVVVDNSVVEVHANNEAIITTRVYPWLSSSVGAGLLASNLSSPVNVTNMELWDGLINAWPGRPENSSTGLVWDGPTASIYGLWTGI